MLIKRPFKWRDCATYFEMQSSSRGGLDIVLSGSMLCVSSKILPKTWHANCRLWATYTATPKSHSPHRCHSRERPVCSASVSVSMRSGSHTWPEMDCHSVKCL